MNLCNISNMPISDWPPGLICVTRPARKWPTKGQVATPLLRESNRNMRVAKTKMMVLGESLCINQSPSENLEGREFCGEGGESTPSDDFVVLWSSCMRAMRLSLGNTVAMPTPPEATRRCWKLLSSTSGITELSKGPWIRARMHDGSLPVLVPSRSFCTAP